MAQVGKLIFCKPVNTPRRSVFTLQACKLTCKLVYIHTSLLKPISYLPYLVGCKLNWKLVYMETVCKLDI
jgi:hypothetical protein